MADHNLKEVKEGNFGNWVWKCSCGEHGSVSRKDIAKDRHADHKRSKG